MGFIILYLLGYCVISVHGELFFHISPPTLLLHLPGKPWVRNLEFLIAAQRARVIWVWYGVEQFEGGAVRVIGVGC